MVISTEEAQSVQPGLRSSPIHSEQPGLRSSPMHGEQPGLRSSPIHSEQPGLRSSPIHREPLATAITILLLAADTDTVHRRLEVTVIALVLAQRTSRSRS